MRDLTLIPIGIAGSTAAGLLAELTGVVDGIHAAVIVLTGLIGIDAWRRWKGHAGQLERLETENAQLSERVAELESQLAREQAANLVHDTIAEGSDTIVCDLPAQRSTHCRTNSRHLHIVNEARKSI